MNNLNRAFLLLLLLLLACPLLLAKSNTDYYFSKKNPNTVIFPGKIIVKYQPTTGNIEGSSLIHRISSVCQVNKIEPFFKDFKRFSNPKRKTIDLSLIHSVYISPSEDAEAVCSRISQIPGIEYAEPVMAFPIERIPNDIRYGQQQFHPQIKSEEAWDIAQGDSTIIVGIIDTGVDWDHPDLAANIWSNSDEVLDGTDTDGNGYVDDIRGWDFVNLSSSDDYHADEDGTVADNNPMDFDGHGSHCSGLAAAVTDNSIGVAGVTWRCKVMPLRVGWQTPDGDGLIRMDWVAQAYIYAADNGAHVTNLSTGSSRIVADAARYAFENDVVIAKSAGNADSEETDPLELELFSINVAAVDEFDSKASYSSFGDWVKVSAPGGDQSAGRRGMLSTVFDNKYQFYQGTSMSAPVVAGLAALIKSVHPDWTAGDVTVQIVETTDPIDHLNPDYAGKLGTGRINSYRALTETVVAKPNIKLLSYSIIDSVAGNGNQLVDIGERVEIAFNLQNTWGTAHNLTASLQIDDWAVTVEKGSANFGTVYGLGNLDSTKLSNVTDPFVIIIDSLALPHRITATIQITADDGYQRDFELIMPVSPSILYVDDAEIDVTSYYLSVLDDLGFSFEYWSHQNQGTPKNLNSYSSVIWNCEWTFPSIDRNDRQALQIYLDDGGSLFLSGQDIGWDLCDGDDSSENEFDASNGRSVEFYENYLRSQYLLDTSEHSNLDGVADDPISDGLNVQVYQPQRDFENQYPDEVVPINDGISVFNYPNGSSGAVRYAGDYRTVNFAFGGFESITDSATRAIVMTRILGWLNGLTLEHDPLSDTENITDDYEVIAKVKSVVKPISKVEVYWDDDGELPLANKINMVAIDDTTFQAFIPAQDSAKIMYTIFVQNEAGFYHGYEFYTFKTGQDQVLPTFTNAQPIRNNLDKFGPYNCQLNISDNQGIDTSSVWLYYGVKDSTVDSVKMAALEDDIFQADIPGIADYGQTIVYHAQASDIALNANMNISPEYEFTIGLDGFEDPTLSAWEIVGNWAVDTSEVNFGMYSVTETPGRNLHADEEHILQLKAPLDLSSSEAAFLTFWHKYGFHRNKAFGYVEVSVDSGVEWTILHEVTSLGRSWKQAEISLAEYTGLEKVWLRFRVEATATSNDRFIGWHLDGLALRANLPTAIDLLESDGLTPDTYSLSQNYPNPFNPSTKITYGLPKATQVSIKIFNLLGQQVKSLVNQKISAGMHHIVWDGTDENGQMLTSGVYFYQLKTASFVQTRKMVWMK